MIKYQTEKSENSLLQQYIESYVLIRIDSNDINSKEILPGSGASGLMINQPFIVDNKNFTLTL